MANIFNTPLDSLPYYDKDLDEQPHLRPQINSLLAIELRSLLPKTSTSTPTNLTHLSSSTPRPLPNSSPLLLAELQRIESKRPIPKGEGLDTTRYSLPIPTGESIKEIKSWELSYKSSQSQLEHQRLRNLNGGLLNNLGSNHWRLQNFIMENSLNKIELLSEEIKFEVENVNRDRKLRQEKGGEDLTRLEKKWTELVSGNMQLEIGCMTLEAEVAQLQQKHQELTQQLQTPVNV